MLKSGYKCSENKKLKTQGISLLLRLKTIVREENRVCWECFSSFDQEKQRNV